MSIRPEKILTALASLINKTEIPPDLRQEEKELGRRVLQFIKNIDGYVDVEEEEGLSFIESESNDELDFYFEHDPLHLGNEVISYDRMVQILTYKAEHPNYSFKTLQTRFRELTSPMRLSRIRKYVEQGGTRREKHRQISEFVLTKAIFARRDNFVIHDKDLRLWAIRKAHELDLPDFVASATWLKEFKKRNKLVSRKITRFVSERFSKDLEDLYDQGATFQVEFMDTIIPRFNPNEIFNMDQSGINYESHGGRTLSFRGEKDTNALAQSMNSLSHSYTVMPLLTMSGEIRTPVLICLQEESGQFGPVVTRTMERPNNLYITCTRSGKVNKEMMKTFFNDAIIPMIDERACFIVDAWRGQSDDDIFATQEKEVEIRRLPEGSTGFMQPLDVFGFRQWKYFIKQFTEKILIEQYDINIHQRDHVLRLNSLIVNQFQSELFRPMFKYAWAKSGFPVEEQPFQSVQGICFDFEAARCQNLQCQPPGIPFIQCSWPTCRLVLCIPCFFTLNHRH